MTQVAYLRFTDEAEALAKLQEAGLLGDDKPVYTKDLLRQWEVPDTDPEAEPGDMVTYQEYGEPYQIGTQRYQHPGLDLIGESWRPEITPTIQIEKWIVDGVGVFDAEAEAQKAKAEYDAAREPDDMGNLPPEAKILLGVSHVRDESKPIIPASKRDGYFVNWIGNELPAVLQPYATKPATPFRVFAGHSPEEIAAKEATSTLEHEGTPQ